MADDVRVLYVDDEPDLLEIGKVFLEQSGEFHVRTLVSAEEALDSLSTQSWDVIISDYQMPGMDGIAFLKAVRERFGDLPFILFTGRGREEVVIDAINNGADFYIQKGGDPRAQFAELSHKIRQVLRRRDAERELRRSEERYRSVVNDQTEMIVRFTADGTITFANKAFHQYFHPFLDFRDLEGKKVYDLMQIEHYLEDDYLRSLTPATPIRHLEHRVLDRDNKTYWQTWSVRALFDREGNPSEYQVVGRDITESRKTEEAFRQNYDELIRKDEVLRISEEKYRTLVDLSLDGIVIIDFSGMILFANQAAGRIVEAADYQAMIGTRNVMEYVAPESRADMLRDFNQVSQGIDTYLVHYKLVTETEQAIWVECIGKKIPFGDASAMLVSMRDITERKRAEEKLLRSEKKFATVFRNSPVPLTLVSVVDGVFGDVSDAFLRSSGYSRDEVVGRKAEELGIFVDRREYERFVSILREQGTVSGVEMRCRTKSGDVRTCRFSSSMILMDERPYLLSTVDDITEHRPAGPEVLAQVRSTAQSPGRT